MLVTYYQRKDRSPPNYSIEGYFEGIRQLMPPSVDCRVAYAPQVSSGVWRRLHNVLDAPWHQGQINHVTGDIHYAACLLRRARTVLTVHDCGALQRTSGLRRELLRHGWFTVPARRSAVITTNSAFTKADLVRQARLSPDQVRVIPVFVSQQLLASPKPELGSPPRLLHLGTATNKNLIRVAEALRGLDCQLDIIGQLDAAQEAALRRNRIRYCSRSELPAPQVRAAYEACDVVLLVSTWEGFGMPIIEANRVGRPVVAGDVTSMPEVAGAAACLVDPYSVRAIREGVLKVLGDVQYRQQLVAHGFENCRRFHPVPIVRSYYELYCELLGREPEVPPEYWSQRERECGCQPSHRANGLKGRER